MTLPASAPPISRGLPADPFGLWQAPAPGGVVSFGLSEAGVVDSPPAAVWSLELAPTLGGPAALTLREQQVRAIDAGLTHAAERLDAVLANRQLLANRQRPGGLSFAVGEELPEPELFLAQALDALDPDGAAVSYGLREDLAALARIDWGVLRQRLQDLFDTVNRQLLHFVWVDSNLEGRLAARTVVAWSGDLSTCCRPGLTPEQVAAHQRSLTLALASRSANLRVVVSVAQMAAKIALAVTTPLGPVQALALAWEFVSSIVLPMVQKPSSR